MPNVVWKYSWVKCACLCVQMSNREVFDTEVSSPCAIYRYISISPCNTDRYFISLFFCFVLWGLGSFNYVKYRMLQKLFAFTMILL